MPVSDEDSPSQLNNIDEDITDNIEENDEQITPIEERVISSCAAIIFSFILIIVISLEELYAGYLIIVILFGYDIYFVLIVVIYIIALFIIHCSSFVMQEKFILFAVAMPRLITMIILLIIDIILIWAFVSYTISNGGYFDTDYFLRYFICPALFYVVPVGLYTIMAIVIVCARNDGITNKEEEEEDGEELLTTGLP